MATSVFAQRDHRRSEQHADGVQIVGGTRHNVARAIALKAGVAEDAQAREAVVALIELTSRQQRPSLFSEKKLLHSIDYDNCRGIPA